MDRSINIDHHHRNYNSMMMINNSAQSNMDGQDASDLLLSSDGGNHLPAHNEINDLHAHLQWPACQDQFNHLINVPDGSILQDNSNKPSSMSQSGRKDIIMGESADIVTSSSGLVVTGEHNNMDIQDMAGLHELLYPRLSIRELLFADEAWEQGLNQLVIQHSQGPHLGSHLLQGPSPQPGQPGQQGDELLSVKCEHEPDMLIMAPHFGNPNTTHFGNPNTTQFTNPNTTHFTNPNTTHFTSPNATQFANPNATPSINPNATASINPNTAAASVNPNTTPSVSPNTTASVNPNTTVTHNADTNPTFMQQIIHQGDYRFLNPNLYTSPATQAQLLMNQDEVSHNNYMLNSANPSANPMISVANLPTSVMDHAANLSTHVPPCNHDQRLIISNPSSASATNTTNYGDFRGGLESLMNPRDHYLSNPSIQHMDQHQLQLLISNNSNHNHNHNHNHNYNPNPNPNYNHGATSGLIMEGINHHHPHDMNPQFTMIDHYNNQNQNVHLGSGKVKLLNRSGSSTMEDEDNKELIMLGNTSTSSTISDQIQKANNSSSSSSSNTNLLQKHSIISEEYNYKRSRLENNMKPTTTITTTLTNTTTTNGSSSNSKINSSLNSATAANSSATNNSNNSSTNHNSSNFKSSGGQVVNAPPKKEKLGERITTLQQLVSPFGKTDTASVLLEAIGYIKFLQEQVQALSSPYLKGGNANNQQQQQGSNGDQVQIRMSSSECEVSSSSINKGVTDLRSRGLCLVPLSFCTSQVVNDMNGADYWSYGGAFR